MDGEYEEFLQKKADALAIIVDDLKRNPAERQLIDGFNRMAGELLILLEPSAFSEMDADLKIQICRLLGVSMYCGYLLSSIDQLGIEA